MASDAMKSLAAMAKRLAAVKKNIADLEEKLAKERKAESDIELDGIPELMKELEMKDFTLKDGTKIEVVDDLKCGITEDNRYEAHKWLVDGGFGGIIKTIVAQQYGAGEHAKATEDAEKISKLTGRAAQVIENVHASTLKAFLKEQRAKGTKIPEKLFGLFPFSKAKVTPPKG